MISKTASIGGPIAAFYNRRYRLDLSIFLQLFYFLKRVYLDTLKALE